MKPNEHFIPVTTSTKSTPEHQKQTREKLEKDTAAFLASGGEIQKLPSYGDAI